LQMQLPDFEAWALFAAVADHGSFRAAAAANAVSVPTVSKAIARLEARLGVALFHRTSRRVTLTAAGEGLADHARTIVASGVAAEEAARCDATQLSGLIRLTAPMSLGLACLGDALSSFLLLHPAVTIDLVLSDARCDLVADGIDLALRIGSLDDSSLLAQVVAPVPIIFVASPAYLDNHGTPLHPNDLSAHRLLGYGHERRNAPVRFTHRQGEQASVPPSGPLFSNNGEVMLPLLLAGQAMALLPHFIVAEPLASRRLVPVLADWTCHGAMLHLVSPPSRLRPQRVTALAAHLIATLRAHALFAVNP